MKFTKLLKKYKYIAISLVGVFAVATIAGAMLSLRQYSKDATPSKTHLETAREAASNNDYAKAEQEYKLALTDKEGEEKAVLRELGFAYQLQGKRTEAIDTYEKSITLDDNDASIYNNLGNLYRDTNQYDKSEANYAKAIQKNPHFTLAITNYSHVLNLQKKYPESIKMLEPLFDHTTKTIDVGLQLVNAYALSNNTDQAHRLSNELSQLDPTNPKVASLSRSLR